MRKLQKQIILFPNDSSSRFFRLLFICFHFDVPVFFFLRISSFAEKYRAALCFTGLVTFIAMYHYFRIFNSFEKAYTPCKVTNGVVNYNDCNADTYGYNPTGHAFNDAYRCKYPRLDIRSYT